MRRLFHAGEQGRKTSFGWGATLAAPLQLGTPRGQAIARAALPCLLLAIPSVPIHLPQLEPLKRAVLLKSILGCTVAICVCPSWVKLLQNKGWCGTPPPCPLSGSLLFPFTSSSPRHLSTRAHLTLQRLCQGAQSTENWQGEEKRLGQHSPLKKGRSRKDAQQWVYIGTKTEWENRQIPNLIAKPTPAESCQPSGSHSSELTLLRTHTMPWKTTEALGRRQGSSSITSISPLLTFLSSFLPPLQSIP